MKAATLGVTGGKAFDTISIHAAREGGDPCGLSVTVAYRRFQSTPPVKAATLSIGVCAKPVPFQSTPPVKAATQAAAYELIKGKISIHAAREGV